MYPVEISDELFAERVVSIGDEKGRGLQLPATASEPQIRGDGAIGRAACGMRTENLSSAAQSPGPSQRA
jgi:hypothetical protein